MAWHSIRTTSAGILRPLHGMKFIQGKHLARLNLPALNEPAVQTGRTGTRISTWHSSFEDIYQPVFRVDPRILPSSISPERGVKGQNHGNHRSRFDTKWHGMTPVPVPGSASCPLLPFHVGCRYSLLEFAAIRPPQASFDPVPYQLQMEAPAEELVEAYGEEVPGFHSVSTDGRGELVAGTRVEIIGNKRPNRNCLLGQIAIVQERVEGSGWYKLGK